MNYRTIQAQYPGTGFQKKNFNMNNTDSTASKTEGESLENSPKRFLNRELSWLKFNSRVLEEACNKAHPLLERIRFLSISASNLDEFYMVRVAGLKAQASSNIQSDSADRMTPAKQLTEIGKMVRTLLDDQQKCLGELFHELEKEKIRITGHTELDEDDLHWLEKKFQKEMFPVLSPVAIDPAHPFPFITNLGFGLALEIVLPEDIEPMMALVILPYHLDRFIALPGDRNRYILLEEVVFLFMHRLFPSFRLISSGTFRVIRDSEMEIDEEAEDLVRTFESALKRRRRGKVIALFVDENMPGGLREFLREQLEVEPEYTYRNGKMIGLNQLSELVNDERPEFLFPKFKIRFPERIKDFGGDCFAAIHAKDILVHHPYESFDVVVQFLRQASDDKNVVAIKQTLYRTSKDSPIVQALVRAAESGKSVTAMIELKARFDEEANIEIARILERSGVLVVFGFMELKTHAKISLVVRKEQDGFSSYVHLGTGNYHPVTAKIYTDLSFFTCDPDICTDAMKIFNYMTGYAKPVNLKKIDVAPINLRKRLVNNIKAEIENALSGKPSGIWAKLNSLVDPEIIDLLYKASKAGVKITLIIRGICCLRPGIPGLSENIKVKSIIGRFLEHSRIACFANGLTLPSPQAKLYISSADWMTRNLDRRIEAFVPINNPTVHQQILEQIMVANIRDTEQSWTLQSDGEYVRVREYGKDCFNAHGFFMTNQSLSGRGSALYKEGTGKKNKKKKGH